MQSSDEDLMEMLVAVKGIGRVSVSVQLLRVLERI